MPSLPPEAAAQIAFSQRNYPFVQPSTVTSPPKVLVSKNVEWQDSSALDHAISNSFHNEHESSCRKRSTNMIEIRPLDIESLSVQQEALEDSTELEKVLNVPFTAVERAKRFDEDSPSEDTVSHIYSCRTVPVTETEEATAPEDLSCQQESRRSQLSCDVRGAFQKDRPSSPKRIGRHRSERASLAIAGTSDELIKGAAKPKASTTSSTTYHGHNHKTINVGAREPGIVRKRVEKIAAKSLSHDGSGSDPTLSRQSTTHDQVPINNVDMAANVDTFEVPDHIDSRGAYGRRKTQDLGFPGALKANKSVRHSDIRAKRNDGHLKDSDNHGTREQVSQRPCQQYPATASLPGSRPSRRQHTSTRVATHPNSFPKVAEKLNVGTPGQINPNVNDTRSNLREAVQTVPDLINLVKSAADNFGVDLDRRPSADDDQKFQNAPLEDTQQASPASCRRKCSAALKKKTTNKEQAFGDPWFVRAWGLLKKLSEARTQLLNDLDTLAANFGEEVVAFAHKQNESIDPAADEFSRITYHRVSKRHLEVLITSISTHLREMMAITQNFEGIVDLAPDVIQIQVVMPRADLPIPIKSTINVPDTLSARDYGFLSKVHAKQPRYKPAVEPRLEFESESEQEEVDMVEPADEYEQEQEVCYCSQNYIKDQAMLSYTEPYHESHTRHAGFAHDHYDLTGQFVSQHHSDSDFMTPPESAVNPGSIEFASLSVESTEQRAQYNRKQPSVQRFQIGQTSMPRYGRFPTSQEVGTDQSFSSDL
jgi:hypothetical protein